MEKATANQYVQSNTAVTKQNQLDSIGISKMQASRFETLARHPETVEKAKADARAEGRIVTRQDVLSRYIKVKGDLWKRLPKIEGADP